MKKLIKLIIKFPLIEISLIFLAFSLLLFVPTDPDFFWHLKYGQITLNEGPISYDPFSYTMSDFKFYDYQWGTHVLIYLLYKIGGFHILAFLFGLIVFFSIYISVKSPFTKHAPRFAKVLMLFIGILVITPLSGIRPQMVTLLCLSAIYFILSKYEKSNSKLVWSIPIIMLLWVNLHPGFLAGLTLQGILLFSYFIKILISKIRQTTQNESRNLQKIKILFFIFVLSIISTFITPFGYKILIQSIIFSFDRFAGENILEWLSPNFHKISGFFAITYLIFSLIIILKDKSSNIREFALIFVFGYMTFNAIRHFPLYVVISIPLVLRSDLWNKISKIQFSYNFPLALSKIVFFLSSIFIFAYNFVNYVYINSSEEMIYKLAGYPYKAINFLKTQNIQGNIFNNYEWGGFLIWQYPEKKTFIDGRMTCWSKNGYKFLEEYKNIRDLRFQDWKEKLNSYNVTIVIANNKTPIANALLSSKEWKAIYKDNTAIILAKQFQQ